MNRDQAVAFAARIQGWHSTDELGWLYDRAAELPADGRWVEVGVWKGRSLAAAVLGSPRTAWVHAVDNLSGELNAQVHPDRTSLLGEIQHLQSALACFDRSFDLGILDAVAAAEEFKDGSIDFVYLDCFPDGDIQAHVFKFIAAWLPKVKVGGSLAGHGYSEGMWSGVVRAVDGQLGRENVANPVGSIWHWRKK